MPDMDTQRNLLVIGTHSADFVWRKAGVIAAVTAKGGEVHR